MNGKRRWRKSWEEKWRDEASDELGLAAKALRALLGDVADLEDGSDVGWAVDGNGRPYTRPRLARLLSATGEQIDEAIGQLVGAGVAVEEGGRLGLVGYRTTQEDPSAKRVREHRARHGAAGPAPRVTPPVTETPDVTPPNAPCNDQKTEDRRQNSESSDADARTGARTLGQRIRATREQLGFGQALVSRRTGIATATLRQFEADEALPVRAELEALAKELGDPGLATLPYAQSMAGESDALDAALELHEARSQLGAEEPRPTLTGELVREYFAPPDTALADRSRSEAWSVVIRRAREEARRNAEDGRANRDLEFMTMASLGRKFGRYLANSDLDRRRDPKQRGSPPTRRPRGPAPPENDDLPPEVPRAR